MLVLVMVLCASLLTEVTSLFQNALLNGTVNGDQGTLTEREGSV